MTRNWSAWSTLIVRDAVLNDRVPDARPNRASSSPDTPCRGSRPTTSDTPSTNSSSNATAGTPIRDLWQGLKARSALVRRDPFEKVFNIKAREFRQQFKRYLRDRVKEFLARENPEDYSVPLGPEFPINPYYFAFSHALSPSGDLVATITYNALASDMDIVLLSAKDGKVLRNITKGFTSEYEYIKYEIDPSLGKCLAWSPDGDRLAFFARDGRRHSLFIISRPHRRDDPPRSPSDVDQPSGPCFYPDGRRLMFGAFSQGHPRLVRRGPRVGRGEEPDQRRILRKGAGDIARRTPGGLLDEGRRGRQALPLPHRRFQDEETAHLRPRPHDLAGILVRRQDSSSSPATPGTPITSIPSTSPPGKCAVTRTSAPGNFYPAPLPTRAGDPPKLIFSSFNKGAFQLFRSDAPGAAEPGMTFAALPAEAEPERYNPVRTFDLCSR